MADGGRISAAASLSHAASLGAAERRRAGAGESAAASLSHAQYGQQAQAQAVAQAQGLGWMEYTASSLASSTAATPLFSPSASGSTTAASGGAAPAGALLTASDASPSTRAMLQSVLQGHYLFATLAPSELAQVLDAMVAVPVRAGEALVRAGDVLYNAFFVVQRGIFDVYAADGGFVTSVCAGGCFGDAALVYSAPAEHTVRASVLSVSDPVRLSEAGTGRSSRRRDASGAGRGSSSGSNDSRSGSESDSESESDAAAADDDDLNVLATGLPHLRPRLGSGGTAAAGSAHAVAPAAQLLSPSSAAAMARTSGSSAMPSASGSAHASASVSVHDTGAGAGTGHSTESTAAGPGPHTPASRASGTVGGLASITAGLACVLLSPAPPSPTSPAAADAAVDSASAAETPKRPRLAAVASTSDAAVVAPGLGEDGVSGGALSIRARARSGTTGSAEAGASCGGSGSRSTATAAAASAGGLSAYAGVTEEIADLSSVASPAALVASPTLRAVAQRVAEAEHVVWRLDRRTFRRVLASTAHRNLAATMDALRSVKLLAGLTDSQLGKLAHAVKEERAAKGDVLIRKGDPGDSLYFLLAGRVVCSGIGSGATAVADVHLSAGACFGERALLLSEPRAATVTVESDEAVVLRLDRRGLTQLLGPLQELLDRNITVNALTSVPLLSHLPASDLSRLASACARVDFERGAAILRRGMRVDCLYVLREGSAAVVSATSGEPLCTFAAGDYFGLEQMLAAGGGGAHGGGGGGAGRDAGGAGAMATRSVVVTTAKATCFVLSRDALLAVVGSVRGLLASSAAAAAAAAEVEAAAASSAAAAAVVAHASASASASASSSATPSIADGEDLSSAGHSPRCATCGLGAGSATGVATASLGLGGVSSVDSSACPSGSGSPAAIATPAALAAPAVGSCGCAVAAPAHVVAPAPAPGSGQGIAGDAGAGSMFSLTPIKASREGDSDDDADHQVDGGNTNAAQTQAGAGAAAAAHFGGSGSVASASASSRARELLSATVATPRLDLKIFGAGAAGAAQQAGMGAFELLHVGAGAAAAAADGQHERAASGFTSAAGAGAGAASTQDRTTPLAPSAFRRRGSLGASGALGLAADGHGMSHANHSHGHSHGSEGSGTPNPLAVPDLFARHGAGSGPGAGSGMRMPRRGSGGAMGTGMGMGMGAGKGGLGGLGLSVAPEGGPGAADVLPSAVLSPSSRAVAAATAAAAAVAGQYQPQSHHAGVPVPVAASIDLFAPQAGQRFPASAEAAAAAAATAAAAAAATLPCKTPADTDSCRLQVDSAGVEVAGGCGRSSAASASGSGHALTAGSAGGERGAGTGSSAAPSSGALSHLQSVAQPLDTSIRLEDLERCITVGVGTFGRVYMVRHVVTGQLYALKELKKATLIKMNQTRNVVYERAVMAAIRHPFLLRLVNTYQSPSKLFMLTEYVHGGELFNLLGDMETLPADHARFYAACTLSGLAHLHSLGIVYRDLKVSQQRWVSALDAERNVCHSSLCCCLA